MVTKKEADVIHDMQKLIEEGKKKETNMKDFLKSVLFKLIYMALLLAGPFAGYFAYSSGIITPKPKLSVASIACEERLYRNASSFDDYEAIRTKGGCDMYAPYAEAYPKAKVALKVQTTTTDIQEGETTSVGKP
jgi:hypothetical protein